MANERQRREIIKCLNCLQQVPDYTQPLFQVMDAALAHVKERQSTELIICSGEVAHCQCTRSFCRAEMGADIGQACSMNLLVADIGTDSRLNRPSVLCRQ